MLSLSVRNYLCLIIVGECVLLLVKSQILKSIRVIKFMFNVCESIQNKNVTLNFPSIKSYQ